MKLGLIIKLTSNGEQEFFAVNKQEDWAKFATDSRSIIKDLNGFDGSGKSAIIVKILGNLGYLLGVVKARPEGSGRLNDNTTAWIHVPTNMQISGSELCSVISCIDEQLSAALGINPAIIEELFSKEYSEKDVQYSALSFVRNNPDGCIGWCTYGKGANYQLYELLGDSIAQIHYKKYKCICFVDNASGLSFDAGEKIKQNVSQAIKIDVPIDNNGFTPFIKSTNQNIPFNKDIEVPYNTTLSIIWKKEGFRDIVKEVKADRNFSNKLLAIQESERQLIFKRSWIKVTNCKYKELDNSEIYVNETLFAKDVMYITEVALRDGLKIRVNHNGYETTEKTINKISSNIQIILDDRQYSKEYTLCKEDGKNLDSDARIIVKMNNHYTGMPLKGYRSNNGYIIYENNLVLKIKWFLLGIASVFVIGFLWAGAVALDDWIDNHKFQLGWPPIIKIGKPTEKNLSTTTTYKQESQSISSEDSLKVHVCNYLKSSSIWHRDTLAQYELTKDLFDYMNTFNLERLVELEKTDLKDIDKIKELVDASRYSLEKKIDPKIGKEDRNGKYNTDTDFGINVNNYISWIKEQHNTTEKSSSKKADKSTPASQKQPASENKKHNNKRGGI